MEDTLREKKVRVEDPKNRLNPCFNGRYSQSGSSGNSAQIANCLNPCFNGRYSQRPSKFHHLMKQQVLILVLMEDTLRVFGLIVLISS